MSTAASDTATHAYALVTGASSGIGYELARLCAAQQFDLLVAADEPGIDGAAEALRAFGVAVQPVQADLSTTEGVDRVLAAAAGRPIDYLIANAGHGLGRAFLDREWPELRHVIDTNVTGTVYLLHRVGREMRARGQGRILVTGSTAGVLPGPFQAVYNASKAFIDSFTAALRNELGHSGVTVTCLMPGVTESRFFERAGMLDTKMGSMQNKDDTAEVARIGFEAMMKGEGEVVSGWHNKAQVALSGVTPSAVLAEMHRKVAEPGSAND